ncbi:MAG TPA: cobalamin-dependent protein, partial [Candidatus Lokiarchaeia archaeon]|nr:cobalamin-dependent protein [Candidatus Lokiarchaeia archaeon]
MSEDEIIDELVRRIQLGVPDMTIGFIKETNVPIENIPGLLQKVMERIGILWEEEKISLTQIYVAGMIVSKIIEKYFPVNVEPDMAEKPLIILGSIAEDCHSLGKELVKRFLAPFFVIRDLGIDVPPEEFVRAAAEESAPVIAISAVMMNAAWNIEKLRTLIDQNEWEKKPLLIVGGAPFNLDPGLWQRLGADYMIPSAIEAP